jgi:hypothetical protein
MRDMNWAGRGLRRALGAAAMLGMLAGCSLDEVEEPALDGPSETGVSIRMTVSPDILLANGFSTSVVTAQVFGPNGQALANREIVFSIADAEGHTADIGTFVTPPSFRDLGTATTVRTNSQGIAQVVYEAPARTDATANQRITIQARPIGNDAFAARYSSVAIELRSPEPRLFPQDPNNTQPECNFAVQAPNGFRAGTTILYQSTSFDPDGAIVRYEWFFSDGTSNVDHPDIAHVFRSPGVYNVTHVVTDNGGKQAACAAPITIF